VQINFVVYNLGVSRLISSLLLHEDLV